MSQQRRGLPAGFDQTPANASWNGSAQQKKSAELMPAEIAVLFGGVAALQALLGAATKGGPLYNKDPLRVATINRTAKRAIQAISDVVDNHKLPEK
jgi:hypothetical protein